MDPEQSDDLLLSKEDGFHFFELKRDFLVRIAWYCLCPSLMCWIYVPILARRRVVLNPTSEGVSIFFFLAMMTRKTMQSGNGLNAAIRQWIGWWQWCFERMMDCLRTMTWWHCDQTMTCSMVMTLWGDVDLLNGDDAASDWFLAQLQIRWWWRNERGVAYLTAWKMQMGNVLLDGDDAVSGQSW